MSGPFFFIQCGFRLCFQPAYGCKRALPEGLLSPYGSGEGRLAQLEEHLVYTERVGGSRPSPPTISPKSLAKIVERGQSAAKQARF